MPWWLALRRVWFLVGFMAAAVVALQDEFPALSTVLDMAALSLVVYKFAYDTRSDDDICQAMNQANFSAMLIATAYAPAQFSLPDDFACHWYYHDRVHQGTQLMIVSSTQHNYLAVAFAGTDDYKSMLQDVDILTKPFGNGANWTLPSSPKNSRVHAGFDNAVFDQGLFDQIVSRFDAVRSELEAATGKTLELHVTGHSLGAADAILAAVGLASFYNPQEEEEDDDEISSGRVRGMAEPPSGGRRITTLNFGCPCVANRPFRNYVHNNNAEPLPLLQNLAIWRFVLGWDLVPRLPELFYHVGHTVQLDKHKHKLLQAETYGEAPLQEQDGKEDSVWTSVQRFLRGKEISATSTSSAAFQGSAKAYYQHYGDGQQHYAAVPLGWNMKPYIWVPGAVASHHAARYWQFLFDFQDAVPEEWIAAFVPFSQDNTDDHPPHVDDDFYVNPPDDDNYL